MAAPPDVSASLPASVSILAASLSTLTPFSSVLPFFLIFLPQWLGPKGIGWEVWRGCLPGCAGRCVGGWSGGPLNWMVEPKESWWNSPMCRVFFSFKSISFSKEARPK